MIDRRVLAGAAAIAAVLVAAVSAITLWVVPGRRDDIWVDLARAGIQLVVIIGLGGVVSLVLRDTRKRPVSVDGYSTSVAMRPSNSW